jgi:hypothetical protein
MILVMIDANDVPLGYAAHGEEKTFSSLLSTLINPGILNYTEAAFQPRMPQTRTGLTRKEASRV